MTSCHAWQHEKRQHHIVMTKFVFSDKVLSGRIFLWSSSYMTISYRTIVSNSLWVDYTIHGILQARIVERVAVPFSKGSSWPRNWTQVSCIAGRFFTKLRHQGSSSYITVKEKVSDSEININSNANFKTGRNLQDPCKNMANEDF